MGGIKDGLHRVQWPANPDYGSGIYRRRVCVQVEEGEVLVELEDCNHGFRVCLQHDGKVISAISAEAIRYPHNTCPEAVSRLDRFLSLPINVKVAALRTQLAPEEQCTHLYDMAMLAHSYASLPKMRRVYDISVDDEVKGVSRVSITRDGYLIHEWSVRDGCVSAPKCYKGLPMMRGFYDWASREFSDQNLEAAVLLQRGYFVSHTRRYDFKNAYGGAASRDGLPHGSCYTYNYGVVERAYRVDGSVRDFTHHPGLLLKFIDS